MDLSDLAPEMMVFQVLTELECGGRVARPTAIRDPARGFIFLGLFLCATFGLPLASRLLRTVPVSSVAGCDVYYSHGPKARVHLADGTYAHLGTADLAFPERCLAPGAQLEKRRMELAVRVDGVSAAVGTPDIHASIVGATLGAASAILGSVLALRRRSGSSPPDRSGTVR